MKWSERECTANNTAEVKGQVCRVLHTHTHTLTHTPTLTGLPDRGSLPNGHRSTRLAHEATPLDTGDPGLHPGTHLENNFCVLVYAGEGVRGELVLSTVERLTPVSRSVGGGGGAVFRGCLFLRVFTIGGLCVSHQVSFPGSQEAVTQSQSFLLPQPITKPLPPLPQEVKGQRQEAFTKPLLRAKEKVVLSFQEPVQVWYRFRVE